MKSIRKHSMAAAVLTVLLLVTLPVMTVFAGTEGQLPGTGADDAGTGTIAWTNPGYITNEDTNYAKATLLTWEYSHYLKGTNFGFSIPDGSPIIGIQVNISRKASSTLSIRDNVVKLVKPGLTPTLSDNRAKSAKWTNLWELATYGSYSDVWGTTWTAADLNDPGFGVVFSVVNTNTDPPPADRVASVDYIEVTVSYGVESTTGVNCTSPVTYRSGTTCVVTVTRTGAVNTPSGDVSWSTDGSGTFSGGGLCTLTGSGGASATCSVVYTPTAVGDGSHLITASYQGDDNFAGSQGTQALAVNPAPLEVTADAASKMYGNADPAAFAYHISAGALLGGDTLVGVLTRALGEDVGPYAIQQGTLTAGPNYDLTFVSANFTINPRTITVTAVTDTKEYDGNVSSDGVPTITSPLGLVPGDTATWTQVFANKNVAQNKIITPQGTVNDGNGGANYAVTFQSVNTGVITARPIEVTADSLSKAFGEVDPPLTYEVTSGSLVAGDVFTGVPVRDAGEAVGTYPIRVGTLSAGPNYTMSFVEGIFTITPMNYPPTNLTLSPSTVKENRPAGTKVGNFTTTDPNVGDTFTYTFCGGANDSSFQIAAGTNVLKTKVMFNYEVKKSYSICVQTSDGHGGTFRKTLTVTIGDLPETFYSAASQDGWVLESGEFSGQGGTINATGAVLVAGDNAADKQYRSILSFNTAGIPDGAVITGVTLKIRQAGAPVGTNPFTTHGNILVDIRKGPFSSNSALQTTDFQAAPGKLQVMVFTNNPVSGWYSKAMGSGGFPYINKGGLTQFRLRFALDDNDDLSADYLKFNSGNSTTAAYRPVLIIKYYVP